MTYKKELLSQAVKGTDDYHDFMRQVMVISLKKQAGFVPEIDPNELKWYRNWYHWQSRDMHMGVGNLWIFFAVGNGHFTTGEAVLIWRYGQALKFPRMFKYRNPEIGTNEVLMDAIEYLIKNPRIMTNGDGDIVYNAIDEFTVRRIFEADILQPYEIYPNKEGGIDIRGKKFREICRLIDNMILWVYTGREHITATDMKELFTFMSW